MPNTLAHLGISGIMTRSVIKKADLIFIYVGAIIPDIPWIIQRLVSALNPHVNTYDLRLYCIVLASLFFSLILSAAIAFLIENSGRIFAILALGSLIHLFLDSIEIKWANGIHLFAPFSWKLFNIGIFWPEHIVIYIITALGLVYLLFQWRATILSTRVISFDHPISILGAVVCFFIYFSLPLLFMNTVEEADNHFVKTLRNIEHRSGSYVEVDRGFYSYSQKGSKYITPFNEELKITNLNLSSSKIMSIRAKFLSKDQIEIIEYHIHFNRDIFSYAGLFIIIVLVTILLTKK
jgi:hypothetical protein